MSIGGNRMRIRELFSNTAETGATSDFNTVSYPVLHKVIVSKIEKILSPERGFRLIHKSEAYGECMFSHKLGEVTLTIIQSSSVETSIGMYVTTKKRFGFPKKWGKAIYTLINQELR